MYIQIIGRYIFNNRNDKNYPLKKIENELKLSKIRVLR